MNKKTFIPTIVFVVMIILYFGYDLLYFSPPGVALKVDNIRISNEDYDEIIKDFDDIVLTNKHIVDTIILSEIAIEIGLADDLSLNDSKIEFKKRKELVEKLKHYYMEIHSIPDEELLALYNEKYPTVYEYIAIDTDKSLDEVVEFDLSYLDKSQGTIEDLNNLNIVEPLVHRWYVLPENGVSNRFVHVLSELPKEITFEEFRLEKIDENKETFMKETIEKLLNQSYAKYDIIYYRAEK